MARYERQAAAIRQVRAVGLNNETDELGVWLQPIYTVQRPPDGMPASWPEPYDDIEEWGDE